RFHASLAGLRTQDARLAADRALQTVGLEGAGRKLIRGYPKDALQRFGLAVALVAGGMEPPDLLILDEPALGLDSDGQLAFKEIVLDCQKRGNPVLICPHQLPKAERACTAAGVLRACRPIAQTHLDDSPRFSADGTA